MNSIVSQTSWFPENKDSKPKYYAFRICSTEACVLTDKVEGTLSEVGDCLRGTLMVHSKAGDWKLEMGIRMAWGDLQLMKQNMYGSICDQEHTSFTIAY